MDEEKEIEVLKAQVETLKKENKELKKKAAKDNTDNSAWEFHWNGRGSYEEAYRGFYGDFS